MSNQSPGFLVRTPAISAISLLQRCLLAWVHVPVDAFFVMLFHGLKIHRPMFSFHFLHVLWCNPRWAMSITRFLSRQCIALTEHSKRYGHITRLILNVCYLDRKKGIFWRSKWLYAIEKIVVYLFPQQVDHWDVKNDIGQPRSNFFFLLLLLILYIPPSLSSFTTILSFHFTFPFLLCVNR